MPETEFGFSELIEQNDTQEVALADETSTSFDEYPETQSETAGHVA